MSAPHLRVAVLVRAYPTVSETFIREQISVLRRAGHTVDVFSLHDGGDLGPEFGRDDAGVRYLIGPVLPPGPNRIRALRRLLSSLRSPLLLGRAARLFPRMPRVAVEAIHALPALRHHALAYDVVHAHFGPTGALALVLRRMGLLAAPLVTTFHGVDLAAGTGDPNSPFPYPWLFSRGEAFTVNSAFSRSRALDLGAPPERLHQLPVGVDVARIPYSPRSLPAGASPRLLSVGRLEEVKGFGYGLEALAEVRRRGVPASYTIIGGGALEASLRQRAARLGVGESVRLTGPLPFAAVVEELARHHLFLMPGVATGDGQVEAQGRVLLEAQASGLPIVASRIGGIPESVAPGAGQLVPPRDAASLAEAVVELCREPGRWEGMGEAGRRHVEAHFDQARLLTRLVDIYAQAVATARVRRQVPPP